MTTSTLGTRTLPRPTLSVDGLRTRFASSWAERRAHRAFRAQERAFASLHGAARTEVLAAARRA